MRKLPVLLGLLMVLAGGGAARGDPPLPMGIPDIVGARGLALGAYRGLAGGNDSIFVNPAALAARRRYAIETQWLVDRTGSDNALQLLGGSVVDSSEGSVAGGFAYTRVISGPWQGNLFHLPVAVPLGDTFFVGATGKYQSIDGPGGNQMRAANFDAAAFWQPSTVFSLGGAIYNVLDAGHRDEQPRAYGAGAAVGDDRRFHLAVDWRGDTQRQGKLTSLYAVGGEVLVSDLVPLRAGYVNDGTRNASFWSAGAGFVSSSGLALDLAYRQCIERSDERILAVGLKIFVTP